MKSCRLGEGIWFVFWNGLTELNLPVPQWIMEHFKWTEDSQNHSFWEKLSSQESAAEKTERMLQMVRSAKFVLSLAGITSIVLKCFYFNTLHIYLRAMNVFNQLQDDSPPRSKKRFVLDDTETNSYLKYIFLNVGRASVVSAVSYYVSEQNVNPSRRRALHLHHKS